jgi:ABC-2 type transport system ATP-binding protein
VTAAIEFHGLTKRYRHKTVLETVDFEVRAGEFFGLIGSNGAGKTTLLKIMLDLVSPDQGSVRIFGEPCRNPAVRGYLAYLPERFNAPAFATGTDLLRFMCALHAVQFSAGRAMELCRALDMEADVLAQRVSSYSKGMAQKLGLVACLLVERQLLVLDEPMSGLDPKARALVRRQLRAGREQGRTVLFSTHLLQDLQDLCDRFAVLHEGHVVFVGTTDEYCAAYAVTDLESAYLASVGAVDTGGWLV